MCSYIGRAGRKHFKKKVSSTEIITRLYPVQNVQLANSRAPMGGEGAAMFISVGAIVSRNGVRQRAPVAV